MVDVVSVNGGLGGLESYKVENAKVNGCRSSGLLTKSNFLVESNTGASFLGLEFLGVKENSELFLETSLSL